MEASGPRGEFELIAAIRERVARAGAPATSPGLVLASGDDAAITVRDGAAVISVDALVEGVHFRIPPFSAKSVGHKALAVALSDLAAMGAEPCEAYVQLGVPEHLPEADLLELADGLGAIAAAHRVVIAGGDVSRAGELIVAVTAVGRGEETSLVRRGGARPGDLVAVTGELGGAAAGLVLLDSPPARLEPAIADTLSRRQREPEPRLAAGRALAAAGVNAMIDVSDGVATDARHVAVASRVSVQIDLPRLPVQQGVAEVAAAAGLDPLDLAASGGEDYELLVTIPPERFAAAALAAGRLGLTEIGTVEEGEGLLLSGPRGVARKLSGFDQLRSRAPSGRA